MQCRAGLERGGGNVTCTNVRTVPNPARFTPPRASQNVALLAALTFTTADPALISRWSRAAACKHNSPRRGAARRPNFDPLVILLIQLSLSGSRSLGYVPDSASLIPLALTILSHVIDSTNSQLLAGLARWHALVRRCTKPVQRLS